MRFAKKLNTGLTWLHSQLDDAAYQTCWEEGRAMTAEQTVAYAVQEQPL